MQSAFILRGIRKTQGIICTLKAVQKLWKDGHFTPSTKAVLHVTNISTFKMAVGDNNHLATLNVAALYRCQFCMHVLTLSTAKKKKKVTLAVHFFQVIIK